jgi:hypothetical protein
MPEEEISISEEAEAAARVERERLFQSRIADLSNQLIAARAMESLGRALGMDPDKVPADLRENLRLLREQMTSREPPPLEESQVPPTGEHE